MINKFVIHFIFVDAFQTRAASKMAGGATKNRKRGKKTPRGIKVEEGQEVQRQTILCTQLQLRYYPGQNVSMMLKTSDSCFCKTLILHFSIKSYYLFPL